VNGALGSAIVTGAASGIGRATVQRLVADGFSVVALDRDGAGIASLAGELPGQVTPVEIDLSELARIEPCVASVIERHGAPAALVNAAGIALVASLTETDLSDWQRILDVNLTAPMLVSRAVVPAMVANGGGAIVHVASVAALLGARRRAAYCAAKAGLLGLTRAMAADYAASGVRVNVLCPGTVETGYTTSVLAVSEDPDSTREFMTQRQVIGRMGTPEEMAATIAFLAGPGASFFHGSTVVADGGRSLL
jgi:NAD(P)-dependent dehydrogenase (short-subunit alcohol dehydrogenase family)